MEKQVIYIKLNEADTIRILIDSPVEINQLVRKLGQLDRVNSPSTSQESTKIEQ